MLKLVRLDGGSTAAPPPDSGLVLPPGLHPFGRGIFLDCEDKRVSRRHGQLDVADQTVVLTSLHQNPCFIIKNGCTHTKLLTCGSADTLVPGDKFGLLPSSYWYELVLCDRSTTDPSGLKGSLETNSEKVPKDEVRSQSPLLLARENGHSSLLSPTAANVDLKAEESEDEIQFPEEPEDTHPAPPESPNLLGQNECSAETSESPSSMKRAHTEDSSTGASPAKLPRTDEPEDLKPNPADLDAALSSAAVLVVPTATVKQEVKAEPPAPAQTPATPPAPGRERCIYGAQCYRRNPQHKQAFSHPGDDDWGTGAQGLCPWGAGCTRRDPRHWRDHTHPPGARQPPPGAGPSRGPLSVVRRHGNTFYINAHSVNFHEDHFSVEDSDGEGAADAKKRTTRKQHNSRAESDVDTEDSPGVDPANVLPAKRKRKQVKRPSWSGSESENDYDMEDPFMTDGSEEDEWLPDNAETPSDYTQSQ